MRLNVFILFFALPVALFSQEEYCGQEATNFIAIELNTDAFSGDDNHWTIVNEEGEIVSSVSIGQIENAVTGDEVVTWLVALDEGCHTFTLFDDYGDGLDASRTNPVGPNGNFSMYSMDGDGELIEELLSWEMEDGWFSVLTTTFEVSSVVAYCADEDDNGICDLDLGSPGCTFGTACNYTSYSTSDDGSCDFFSCIVFGCNNSAACNFNPEATINDGTCDFFSCIQTGCTLELACNYDDEADVNDGSCEFSSCAGCTNACASNYEAFATLDNGSCLSVLGCNVADACNYNSCADTNDGSCDFESCYGCTALGACNYNPMATFDDGGCDFLTCVGCTYPVACNFSEEFTKDDGSCDFSCLTAGCSLPEAINFDQHADGNHDDMCKFIGCQDTEAINFDPIANYPGECVYLDPCPGDFSEDGLVDIVDLLDLFTMWNDTCPWVFD